MAKLSCCIGVVLACISISFAALPSKAQSGLEKVVTIERERVFLGELIEMLAHESGVRIEIDSRLPESGDVLCVSLSKLTIRQAMDLLRSLYSHREAEWLWTKEATPQGNRIAFAPTLHAKELARELQRWHLQAVGRQLEAYRRTRALSPEDQGNLKEYEDLLPPPPFDEVRRGAADLLLDLIPEGQLGLLVEGSSVVRVPAEALPLHGRALLNSLFGAVMELRRKERAIGPDPLPFEWVEFARISYDFGYAIPDVQFRLGNRQGYSGSSLLGGHKMNDLFEKILMDKWIIEGDIRQNDAERRRAAASDPFGLGQGNQAFESRLIASARTYAIPLLARLPRTRPRDPGPPNGQSLRDHLVRLSELSGFLHKWREGALLLGTKKWPFAEEQAARVSWATTKPLLEAEGTMRIALKISDIAAAAAQLTPVQARGLARDWRVFDHVASLHPVFRLCGSSPPVGRAMLSDAGYVVQEHDALLLMQMPKARHLIETHGIRALRIRESEGQPPLPPRSMSLSLEIRGSDGVWRTLGEFVHLPRPPDGAAAPQVSSSKN